MEKKYLFFDIDNTLAVGMPGRQYVPESAQKTLDLLRVNGHFTAIATGRAHAMAEDYRKQLGFENMVSDGGYGITINDKLEYLRPLDYDACLALIDECKEKDIPWAIQIDDSQTRLAPDERFYDFTHDIYMNTQVVPGLDPKNYEQIYKLYIAGLYPIENSLQTLPALPYCRYHKEYFFVEPTNKAWGVKEMVKRMGGDPARVVVFGDGLNDLSIFSDKWTCVAMGNAVDELKAKADFVTKDAGDDGIYYACKYLHLIKKKWLSF